MKKYGLYLLVIFFISCKKEIRETDERLYGKWSDTNIRYTFVSDGNYSTVFLRKGFQSDTVSTDSVFGNFSVDKSRNNLILTQKGYKLKNKKEIIYKDYAGIVWNYKIENDSVLQFNSNTHSGKLIRIK